MHLSNIAMAALMATAEAASFESTPTSFQFLSSQRNSLSRSTATPESILMAPSHLSIKSTTSTSLMAYRERSSYDHKQKSRGTRGTRSGGNDGGDRRPVRPPRRVDDNSFGDFDDDNFDDGSYSQPSSSRSNKNNDNGDPAASTVPSTFYSKKDLTDPSFSINKDTNDKQFFQQLCQAAKITRPSRIQSLAWPPLLRGENTIVADQTGSGKTLAYLLPLIQKLHQNDLLDENDAASTKTQRKKNRTGAPRVVVLTPTAELADQIYSVCTSLSNNLGASTSWSFNPFVTTATGSHSTNIRDQIRMLQSTPVDVLISTPGRLSTILRTKSAGLDLGHVQQLVLDEVDFLLVDETFGPQLRTVGVAVQGGGSNDDSTRSGNGGSPQSIFVTATLPEDVLESIQNEFPNVTQLRGPGLHRITPSVHQTLVDVSVPADMNRDKNACFDIKVREMLKSLRARRCNKTLIFCNTVETCRSVENVLRRKDRKGRRNRVWAYHNALSPEARLKNLNLFSSDGKGDDGFGNGGGDIGMESILVCTDRAARGIDFDASPIDHVVLFDFPKDPAEYVRRVGRTARAGRTGASTVLAYGWQLPIARQITGLSGDGKGKNGKGKNAKLDSFTMMKSNDGWDEKEKEDAYYMKGGARRRKEISGTTGNAGRGGGGGGGKKKRGEKPKMWKK